MFTLDNNFPPPLVTLALGLAIWGVAKLQPAGFSPEPLHRILARLTGPLALGFGAGGIIAFRRARTTINAV